MVKTINPKKQELLERVKKAKEKLKKQNIKQEKFFDDVYGPTYHHEHNRLMNLWGGKITEGNFTKNLEYYARKPKKYVNDMATFNRFKKFVIWYTQLGGKDLTIDEIEEVYPKFEY